MSNLPEIQQKARSLRDYMNDDKIKGQLKVALPKWLSIDRFLKVIFGALVDNPKLMDCTKESLLRAVMQCAQLGLEPILGRAYLIPYSNSKQVNGKWVKVPECQMQIGYQGLVVLVRRTGEIRNIATEVVYEMDDFDLDLSRDHIPHKPYLFGDRGKPVFAYTKWQFKDGVKGFAYMTMDQIEKRRDMSQAYQRAMKFKNDPNAQETPWVKWPDEMIKKTALKNHIKMLPMAIDFMAAVEIDDANDLDPSRQIESGYGSPAITLPESTTVDDPALFDKEFADIIKADKKGNPNPAFAAFWEIAREGNTVDGKPPTDDQLKLLALNDKRGTGAFRDAYNAFAKDFKPKPKPGKKLTNDKGAGKKTASGGNDKAQKGKKGKKAPESGQDDIADEYEALQQSDEWQEMALILETNPDIFQKYNGKDVRTFDDAKEFLDAVNSDPDFSSEMPGA